jgi:hypothetical protein
MNNKNLPEQKIEFFKICMSHFMLNKMSALEDDKMMIHNRIQIYHLDADSYYDLIVSEVRIDYARYIFRQIRELMDMYL